MHELRKDPLLSRWAVILERSLKPSEYSSFAVLPALPPDAGPEGKNVPCEFCGERTPSKNKNLFPLIEQGQNGIRVIKGMPMLTGDGGLGRKGEGIYDKMNPIGMLEIVVEGGEGHHRGKPEEAAGLDSRQFGAVLDIYLKRFRALIQDPRIRYVFIFKDRGFFSYPFSFSLAAENAASNLALSNKPALSGHPHSGILATAVIPDYVKRELDGAKHYYEYKERCIFCDIINEEKRVGSRVLADSEHFFAFCPYAPRVPFEFWIAPKRHSCAFEEIGAQEAEDLSLLLPGLLGKMSRALNAPAYNYYIHTAPNRIPRRNLWHTLGDDYHWHIEVLPRLQRMSAIDLGAGFHLITTSPEDAAKYIREA